MVQLQALNYILDTKDVDFLETYDAKYYFNYKDEYEFILNHYRQYRKIPDTMTVKGQFSKFSIVKVSESRDWLCHKLFEEYVYNRLATDVFNNDGQIIKSMSVDAVQAKKKLENLLADLNEPIRSYGVNIVTSAADRYDHLLDKINNPDSYRFSTGLNELDMSIGGLYRGAELLVIFARTNNGKSWIAEKLAVSVWADGNNVGFFSPEMDADLVGYRFDTLFKNFNNNGIQGNDTEFDTGKYKNYINSLQKNKNVFSVTTPFDFAKNPTVSALRDWVTKLDLKMIVIDGLTYLKNERATSNQSETVRLGEISEDLLLLSNELKIPVVLVHQANRTGARDKDGDVNKEAPELDSLRASDAIAHIATRVISLVKSGNTMTLYINKNRYGQVGQKLIYNYEVNEGRFTYVDNPKSGLVIENGEDAMRQDFNDTEEFG